MKKGQRLTHVSASFGRRHVASTSCSLFVICIADGQTKNQKMTRKQHFALIPVAFLVALVGSANGMCNHETDRHCHKMPEQNLVMG
jgi:hypothetical protein